ncbi:juvenile hormone acid O-methyltransferase-like [Bombyx mandarina]|uniref:Juvenile hormone acid O-methyltransferase-like n=1 Tax=Bombyx mandarina TaxID=7092 RepID=A0A6J2JX40_BOMMA|nr:juvenile hormone acid O-methyltransferase-like [Bombyx mandarina]
MNDDAELYENSNSIPRQDAADTLNEYSSRLNWKETGESILDIGSGDGSVTDILRSYLPTSRKILLGCDINERMVKHAEERYGNKTTAFTVLNIEGDIPDEMKGQFDHVFSFYTLHWIRNQEKGFTNIHNLMSNDGECLLTFLAYSPIYSLFEGLKDSPKWTAWLKDFNLFVSPYHDCMEPDRVIEKLFKKIGFRFIDVRSRQKKFVYNKISDFKSRLKLEPDRVIEKLFKKIGFRFIDVRSRQKKFVYNKISDFKITASAINPFKIPEHMLEEFLNDLMEVGEGMGIIDKTKNTPQEGQVPLFEASYTATTDISPDEYTHPGFT